MHGVGDDRRVVAGLDVAATTLVVGGEVGGEQDLDAVLENHAVTAALGLVLAGNELDFRAQRELGVGFEVIGNVADLGLGDDEIALGDEVAALVSVFEVLGLPRGAGFQVLVGLADDLLDDGIARCLCCGAHEFPFETVKHLFNCYLTSSGQTPHSN